MSSPFRGRKTALADTVTITQDRPFVQKLKTGLYTVGMTGYVKGTTPGGEIRGGESSGDALRRKVEHEAGLTVTSTRFIGRRIHPKTSRVMVYGHVEVQAGEPRLGDPDDLEEVRWVSVDETRTLMPDMYGPVRQYLDELQRA